MQRGRFSAEPGVLWLLLAALVVAWVGACAAEPPVVRHERTPNPTCVAFARHGADYPIAAVPVFEDLRVRSLTGLAQSPGDPAHWYLSDRPTGLVRFETARPGPTQELVLDLAQVGSTTEGRVYANELYSFALHPAFPREPYVYVFYLGYLSDAQVFPFDRVVAVSRFAWDGVRFDPESEDNLLLLRGPSPDPDHEYELSDHPGSIVGFGPDGYLYIAFGDFGVFPSTPDLQALVPARKLDSLAGKVVRLDVDHADATLRYGIPADNPLSASRSCSEGTCPEIWASGFRHPWRGSIDPVTGRLWVGDVGWSHFEEIDEVLPGLDYGWPVLEGDRCVVDDDGECERLRPTLQPPLVALPRDQAQAITGGFVYRGQDLAGFQGAYFFSDWIFGTLHVMDPDAPQATHRIVGDTGLNVASFAQDLAGELYVLDVPWGEGGGVYRLVPGAPVTGTPAAVPARLSESGCFEPGDAREPVAAMVPYVVQAELWSDGATKSRHFAIPDGTTLGVDDATGKLTFPPGSVLTKSFEVNGTLAEVRLLVRHEDGAWVGYDYEWNEELHDGFLLGGSAERVIGTQTWTYPSQSDCLTCHTRAAGRTLGLERSQLGPGQMHALAATGYLEATVPPAPALVAPHDATAPLAARARAYLHANCAGCHRAGGTTPVDLDLRFDVPLAATRTCNVSATHPDGLAGTKRIEPGAPERSLLLARMRATDTRRMPPLGTHVVDTDGVALIEAWIRGLECPAP